MTDSVYNKYYGGKPAPAQPSRQPSGSSPNPAPTQPNPSNNGYYPGVNQDALNRISPSRAPAPQPTPSRGSSFQQPSQSGAPILQNTVTGEIVAPNSSSQQNFSSQPNSSSVFRPVAETNIPSPLGATFGYTPNQSQARQSTPAPQTVKTLTTGQKYSAAIANALTEFANRRTDAANQYSADSQKNGGSLKDYYGYYGNVGAASAAQTIAEPFGRVAEGDKSLGREITYNFIAGKATTELLGLGEYYAAKVAYGRGGLRAAETATKVLSRTATASGAALAAVSLYGKTPREIGSALVGFGAFGAGASSVGSPEILKLMEVDYSPRLQEVKYARGSAGELATSKFSADPIKYSSANELTAPFYESLGSVGGRQNIKIQSDAFGRNILTGKILQEGTVTGTLFGKHFDAPISTRTTFSGINNGNSYDYAAFGKQESTITLPSQGGKSSAAQRALKISEQLTSAFDFDKGVGAFIKDAGKGKPVTGAETGSYFKITNSIELARRSSSKRLLEIDDPYSILTQTKRGSVGELFSADTVNVRNGKIDGTSRSLAQLQSRFKSTKSQEVVYSASKPGEYGYGPISSKRIQQSIGVSNEFEGGILRNPDYVLKQGRDLSERLGVLTKVAKEARSSKPLQFGSKKSSDSVALAGDRLVSNTPGYKGEVLNTSKPDFTEFRNKLLTSEQRFKSPQESGRYNDFESLKITNPPSTDLRIGNKFGGMTSLPFLQKPRGLSVSEIKTRSTPRIDNSFKFAPKIDTKTASRISTKTTPRIDTRFDQGIATKANTRLDIRTITRTNPRVSSAVPAIPQAPPFPGKGFSLPTGGWQNSKRKARGVKDVFKATYISGFTQRFSDKTHLGKRHRKSEFTGLEGRY